jgi:predicted MFS family arabinose efflux permease
MEEMEETGPPSGRGRRAAERDGTGAGPGGSAGVPPELRAARRGVTTVFFVLGASYANWLPRIPLIKHDLGLSDGQLGITLLGSPVGVVIGVRVASWAMARWGSRPVTRVASLVVCAALVPIGAAWTMAALGAALVLIGAAMGLMDVGMNAQGVAVERGYGRPLMSGLHGSYSVGALCGALGGSAAARFDVSPLVHLAVTAGVLGCVVWFASGPLLPPGEEPGQGEETGGDGRGRRLLAGPGVAVLLLGLIGLCSFVGEGAVGDWSAVYLRESLSASAGAAGLGYAGCSVAMAAGRLTGDRLVARFGPVTVLRAGSLVAAGGLAVGLLARSEPVAVAGFTLFGLGVAPVAPITFSAAGNLPGVSSSTAISRVTGIGYLGFLGGPPLIGMVADHASLGWALAIPAGLAGLIVLMAGTAAPAAPGKAAAGESAAGESAAAGEGAAAGE